MKFDGYTKIYNFTEREDKILPPINEGDTLIVKDILPLQHFTQPPARYTEASLVKTLEELGIGRPSTCLLYTSYGDRARKIKGKI